MQSRSKQSSRKFRTQRGVTIVEFVGCLVALGGGVVLGSIYLGVDVQTLAAGILEKADIEVPALLREDAQASKAAPAEEITTESQSLDLSSETPLDETGTEENLLEQDATTPTEDEALGEVASEGAELDGAELIEMTDAEKLASTQACWAALNECIREEVDNRSKSITEAGSWQLFDYLLHRKKGHQKVVEAIDHLDHLGVDPRLGAYVHQVLACIKQASIFLIGQPNC